MFLLRTNSRFIKNYPGSRRLTTALSQKDKDSDPEYPPIVDRSYSNEKERQKLEWHEKIKKISTIEEKLIELNIKRYYGYKCLMLNEQKFPYNTLPFFQYATNTELIEEKSHVQANPEDQDAKKLDGIMENVKSEVESAIEFELDGYSKFYDLKSTDLSDFEKARAKSSGLVKQLNRILINALGADHRHLYEVDADVDPRHEAFWFLGGIEPTKKVRKQKEGLEWLKEHAGDPIERGVQYIGQPLLALRHQYPLQPFEDVDFSTFKSTNEKIPKITLDPRGYGFSTDHRHGTIIPGFWPGNVREYGLISFQDRRLIDSKNFYTEEDKKEALHSYGIVTSFAWAYAQACYQGFSTFNDVTYPLATQTVVTNGQFWSFYKYQLNTTVTHTTPLVSEPNHRFNKCWGSTEMKLFDGIDDKGKLQGLNDEVLKNLVTFYLNEPKARSHEMKPFLGKEKKVADLEDLKQRDWLEKTFKHIMSNRPRHRLVPEIYSWEKIYKIDSDTRQMDRRLRFFEVGINPYQRRLDEHQPKYIPRHLRVRGPHDKKKWEATYYPLNHNMAVPRETTHSLLGAPKNAWARLVDRKRKSYK